MHLQTVHSNAITIFPTGPLLCGALLPGRLVGPLPDGAQHEQALLCWVPLCPRQVHHHCHIHHHHHHRYFDCQLDLIRKVNPHEEGDSEGEQIQTALMQIMLQRNTIYNVIQNRKKYNFDLGEETHKTMLEEGGGSEKAFTGICEQMVWKHSIISTHGDDHKWGHHEMSWCQNTLNKLLFHIQTATNNRFCYWNHMFSSYLFLYLSWLCCDQICVFIGMWYQLLHLQADHLDITMIDDDSDEKQEKAIIAKSDALDVFA